MKSRRIVPRNICLGYELLKTGVLYRCTKYQSKQLNNNDFWCDALVWVQENEEILSPKGAGILRKGAIVTIVNEVLYPSVRFDGEFKFLEIQTCSL